MRLALTRPQEDSERSAAVLRARGHDVLIAPLLRLETVDTDLRASWGGLVITSAHAVQALAHHPTHARLVGLPLYAVGRRSADAARAVGFADVVAAGGDLRDLVRTIVADRADARGPLLYLAGEDRSGDLIGDLAVHGIAAELAVIYRAALAPFPPALAEALASSAVDAVLHYSRRSAEAFLAGARAAGFVENAIAVRHLCLSAQVAEPLVAAGASDIAVAAHPDEAALFALLGPSSA